MPKKHLTIHKFLVSSLLLAGLLVNCELKAQDLYSLSLEELLEIKITGSTLSPESLDSVPSAVTVYTQSDIRNLGFRNLSELLQYVPGMQAMRSDISSMIRSFSARGVQSGSSSSDLLVLINGQRLNDNWSGGANKIASTMSLENVSRIEIIRGPGSAVHGSNAYTGVINIVTETDNRVNVSTGTNGYKKLTAQMNLPIKENSPLSVFVSKQSNDGENFTLLDPLTNSRVDTTDGYEQEQFQLDFKLAELSFSIGHIKALSNNFYSVGFLVEEVGGYSIESQFGNIQYQHTYQPNLTLKSKLFFSRHDFEVGGRVSPSPIDIFADGQIEEKETGIELSLSYQANDESSSIFGFELRKPELTNSDANFTGVISAYVPQALLSKRTIKGVFIQHQDVLTQDLHYIVGLRHDDYSNFGSHTSPRTGLVWNVSEQNIFKLLYGEGYKAPAFNITDIINSSVVVANPELMPESSENLEIIWQFNSQNGYLVTSIFQNEISDAIVKIQTEPPTSINGEEYRVKGAEWEWVHQWNDNWRTRVNTMYLFSTDLEFQGAAKKSASASLVYSNSSHSAALLTNYHSSKLDASSNDSATLKGRTLVDFTYTYSASEQWELKLQAKNLFDKSYQSVALISPILAGVPERGREIFIGASYLY